MDKGLAMFVELHFLVMFVERILCILHFLVTFFWGKKKCSVADLVVNEFAAKLGKKKFMPRQQTSLRPHTYKLGPPITHTLHPEHYTPPPHPTMK